MVYCYVTTSIILIRYKTEETMSHYWWYVKLFLMEKVYLCWEEIRQLIIVKFGIHTKDNATMFQQSNIKLSAVSFDMKNNKKLMISLRIPVQSSKSVVWFQEIMFISIFNKKQRCLVLILILPTKRYGSLSLMKEQEMIYLKKEK